MAKWGEGDPRWIVEEREDGTNANNWHWTEKNATKWSKEKLTELLVDLSASDATGEATLTAMDTISGDAIANCRKGKLIFFYELVLKMKWKGKTPDGTVCNGTLEIPNLSEEQDMEDIEVAVTLTSDRTPERNKVKDIVRKKIAELIRQQLAKWFTLLKEEYAVNLVKPTKGKATVTAGVKVAPPKAEAAAPASAPKPVAKAVQRNVTITLADDFRCTSEQLFRALLTEDQVRAYTQSECKIDPKVGGEFSMFGGNISGVFKEVVPHSKIVQAWRFKHWTAGHFSDVTMTMKEKGDMCTLTLSQTGVPEADAESTKAGWRSNQWQRMKAILGFGAGIPNLGF